jgi:hypothetical protein
VFRFWKNKWAGSVTDAWTPGSGLMRRTKAVRLSQSQFYCIPHPERIYKTMPYVLVRHKVSDFSKWKPAYDAHLPARQKAGLKEEHLLRNTDDPNEVVLLFEAKDIEKAKEFASSADLREAMQSAGMVDKPDIYFLG